MVDPDTVHTFLHGVKETHILAIDVDDDGGVPGVRVLVVTAKNTKMHGGGPSAETEVNLMRHQKGQEVRASTAQHKCYLSIKQNSPRRHRDHLVTTLGQLDGQTTYGNNV